MIQTLQQKNQRLIIKLVAVIVGMFVFATVLMPPLYEAFCDWTGLNGKVDLIASSAPTVAADGTPIATPAAITAQFTTKTDKAIPWHFKSEVRSLEVVPGKPVTVIFTATNLAKVGMSGRALPSVSPAQATGYLRKMECFCFQEQYLAAGETKEMPMQFYFTDDMPKEIEEVTLSYTLYKMETTNGSSIN